MKNAVMSLAIILTVGVIAESPVPDLQLYDTIESRRVVGGSNARMQSRNTNNGVRASPIAQADVGLKRCTSLTSLMQRWG